MCNTTACKRAWEETVAWLSNQGRVATSPEQTRDRQYGASRQPSLLPQVQAREAAKPSVDEGCMSELHRALLAARQGCEGRVWRPDLWSKEQWHEKLQAAFGGVQPQPSETWDNGLADVRERAKGARVFFDLGCDAEAVGGEESWLRRGERDAAAVGDDGFIEGWQVRAQQLAHRVGFDQQGKPFDPESPMEEPWDGDSVSELGPVLELQCRARELLGADVPVYDEEPAKYDAAKGEGRKGTHVNLRLQRANAVIGAAWQARIDATACLSGDGSLREIEYTTASGET